MKLSIAPSLPFIPLQLHLHFFLHSSFPFLYSSTFSSFSPSHSLLYSSFSFFSPFPSYSLPFTSPQPPPLHLLLSFHSSSLFHNQSSSHLPPCLLRSAHYLSPSCSNHLPFLSTLRSTPSSSNHPNLYSKALTYGNHHIFSGSCFEKCCQYHKL